MKKEKILLVEDEGVVALDIEQRLTQLGYAVVGTADTAEGALALARAGEPDLVLMDIRIRGGLDGIDLARDLGTRFELPVVFLTGNADEATLRRAVEAEPYGYVLKPFELRTLEATLQTALFRFRAERRLQNMRRWLGDTMRAIPDAVFATDLEQRVTFLNRAAEQLVKMGLAEALRRPLREVLSDPKLDDAVAAMAQQRDDPSATVTRFRAELCGQRFDVSVGPISSDANVMAGVVVLLCGR
jgi:two-component system cell cycle sensor histidine kinase/response regulator CckA